MKIIIIIFLIMLATHYANGGDNKGYDSSEAINLTRMFVTKLRSDTPFLYDDEVKYFGENNLLSYVILHKLEYLDKKGSWQKPKPKYSYFCELIRLNSNILLIDNPGEEYYFSGMRKVIKKNELRDWYFFANVGCVQQQDLSPSGLVIGNSKSVIFGYSIPHKRLDPLSSLVDGSSMPSQLGFVLNDEGVPFLKQEKLDFLLKHVSKLTESGK